MKTYTPKASQVTHDWQVIDATGQTLGRLATQVAIYLRGKHKPTYSPHMDLGDHVVIVNAEKIEVTGAKLLQKVYYRHSGYPGGLKSRTLEQQLAKFPTRVIESAVRGMLPGTALGEAMFRKLHIYVGPNHPHRGQLVESERRKQQGQAPDSQLSIRPEPAARREPLAVTATPATAATETSAADPVADSTPATPPASAAESPPTAEASEEQTS
jgi:large subunit ribosomal protein L13